MKYDQMRAMQNSQWQWGSGPTPKPTEIKFLDGQFYSKLVRTLTEITIEEAVKFVQKDKIPCDDNTRLWINLFA